MNKYILALLCITLTSCTSIETARKSGQELAVQLEEKQDVIETIEQYKKYEHRCETYKKHKTDTASNPFLHTGRTECLTGDALAEKSIDFGCIDWWRKEDNYHSDKCILMRRNLQRSRIDYFGYKRFLPKNTRIKTEEDFLKLVNYYESRFDCHKLKEVTTQEKQDCYNNVIDMTVKMATTDVKCSEAYERQYEALLKEKGEWYDQATNYDPYSHYYLSKKQALDLIKEWVTDFGKEHLCNVKNWETDIRKHSHKL